MNLIYTAAHAGFDLSSVPLGGGAAVCQHLKEVWSRTQPFPFQILDPSLLGKEAPRDKRLVQMSEWSYARFCRAFEHKTTDTILLADPKKTVVLSNDVSEGPDFRRLAERGFPIFTIYHVDVLDYVVNLYLRGCVKPEQVARAYQALSRTPLKFLVPDVLGLVVQKQQDSVQYSKGLIVPSAAMRDLLMRCYPTTDAGKIHVLPWGIWDEPVDPERVRQEKDRLRQEYKLPDGMPVVLTLSRISPEKGQDRLLRALQLWEKQSDYPKQGLAVIVAGEAAYMQGRRFQRTLSTLAGQLSRTRVIFAGYAVGLRKQALFQLADLYVFPSRHESYGLTLLEAMRAGVPVLACDSHGAREVLAPEVGEILPALPESEIPAHLMKRLAHVLPDPQRLEQMGRQAREYAAGKRFSDAAARLAEILLRAS